MTYEDIRAAVRRCKVDTLMAYAFRKACGIPQPKTRGRTTAKVDRYAGAAGLMRQRYGVRM